MIGPTLCSKKNNSLPVHQIFSLVHCLSNAMQCICIGQNIKSRKRVRCPMFGVRPSSVDKIVTSLMDRSSPNVEHSFPVPCGRNIFLGNTIGSCMCACATINGLALASVQCLRLYISITVQDRRMVTIDHV